MEKQIREIMSGGKDRRSRASKTQGWEEAGGEFYQESYPADLEGMQRDPSKIATLLPSKQTRNGKYLPGGNDQKQDPNLCLCFSYDKARPTCPGTGHERWYEAAGQLLDRCPPRLTVPRDAGGHPARSIR